MNTEKKTSPKLPAYIEHIYGNIYTNPQKCSFWDNRLWCRIKTFFQYSKLVDSVAKEIKPGQSILQMGLVFGDQIDATATAVGMRGQYDIIDINPYEITRFNDKYWKVYNCLQIFKQDATKMSTTAKYDIVVCFMLLSMLPDASKAKAINNALQLVKTGGKVVFVDWHNPVWYHPLRYVIRMYNRLRHPFVERLWDRDIATFVPANARLRFSWYKSTYFGRMYQKVVAVRKENSQNEKQSSKSFYAFK